MDYAYQNMRTPLCPSGIESCHAGRRPHRIAPTDDSDEPLFFVRSDAIVTGDTRTLERLLRRNPSLIRERSTRRHRATLLHYVGSNGVESFRQKCPKNVVSTAEVLLKAGAEADMYGGGRPRSAWRQPASTRSVRACSSRC
jgi:hypothetical protein